MLNSVEARQIVENSDLLRVLEFIRKAALRGEYVVRIDRILITTSVSDGLEKLGFDLNFTLYVHDILVDWEG